jgi:ribosomal protein S7
MLNFENKKKLLKAKILGKKKKIQKLRFSRNLTESLLIKQVNNHKKKTKFNFGYKPKLNIQKSIEPVSRVKRKKTVNLSAKTKKGIAHMSFKQVEQKIIGHIMQRGLRAKALAIWMRLLLLLKMHFYKSKFKMSVSSIIMIALNILKPVVILKKRKIAGTVYQIPYFVQNTMRDNAMLIAIRWFLECVNQRIEKDPAVCLYKEFIDVLRKQGLAYKKKKEIYDSAVKNRIYTRFLFAKSRKKRKL